jgi:TRAP-type C4-dicarboxylate transport system permease small subunit
LIFLRHLLEFFSSIMLLSMSVILSLQVFCRFVLNSSLGWPDELSGYLLVWLTFIGSILALADGEHISFTLLVKKAKGKVQLILKTIANLIMIFFLAILCQYSIPLVQRTWNQNAITVPVSKGFMYSAVPVCCGIMILLILGKTIGYYLPEGHILLAQDLYDTDDPIKPTGIGEEA